MEFVDNAAEIKFTSRLYKFAEPLALKIKFTLLLQENACALQDTT